MTTPTPLAETICAIESERGIEDLDDFTANVSNRHLATLLACARRCEAIDAKLKLRDPGHAPCDGCPEWGVCPTCGHTGYTEAAYLIELEERTSERDALAKRVGELEAQVATMVLPEVLRTVEAAGRDWAGSAAQWKATAEMRWETWQAVEEKLRESNKQLTEAQAAYQVTMDQWKLADAESARLRTENERLANERHRDGIVVAALETARREGLDMLTAAQEENARLLIATEEARALVYRVDALVGEAAEANDLRKRLKVAQERVRELEGELSRLRVASVAAIRETVTGPITDPTQGVVIIPIGGDGSADWATLTPPEGK